MVSFTYEIRDSVLETMMIATTLRRVWSKHIRKFCILWSFYFKIERRAKCKSPGEALIFWRSLMAGCQATLQDKNETSWKGPCPVMALSSILFIPTWQMLLNNNDELLPKRMGKGTCVAQRSKHTGDGYQKRLHRDLL